MTSSSGLRCHRRTYLTILESADHALFKMVRYVLLRPLRPELDVIQNNCRVRFVGISRYVHFSCFCSMYNYRTRVVYDSEKQVQLVSWHTFRNEY
jgi:hypothetical protein